MLRNRVRTGRAAITVALVAVFAVGCAGDDGGSVTTAGGDVDIPTSKFEDDTGKAEAEVSVVDNSFVAPYVLVTEGTKVVWSNDGRNQHNVQPVEADAFEGVATTDFAPGQVHSATFDQAGDYPYFCSIHGTKKLSGQSGVIRVVAAEGS